MNKRQISEYLEPEFGNHMRPVCCLILLWAAGCSSSSFFKNEEFRAEEKVARFMSEYFNELRRVLIIDHNHMSVIHGMISSYVPTATLEYPGINFRGGIPGVDCFLIFFDEFSTLEKDIAALKSTKSWNSRARFVLFARNVTSNVMERACDFLWKKQIGRAIFAHEEETGLRVSKCNPFEKTLESVDDRVSRGENVFEDFRNLRGYPIRENHFDQLADKVRASLIYEQIERQYLKAVLKTMNATEVNSLWRYERDDYSRKSNSGKPFGILANFADHLTDVSFTGWTLAFANSNYVELAYPHTGSDSDLVILLPKAGLMSQGDKMTLQFQTTVWIVILVTVFTNAFAWRMIKKKSSSSKPLWDSFGLLFSFSVQPPRALQERLIFAGMTFVGIVVANTFLGRLSFLYTVRMTYKDTDTIEELCQSELRVHVGNLMFDSLIMQNADAIPPCLLNIIEPISFQEIEAHLIGHHRDRAFIMPYQYALKVVTGHNQYADNGQSLMHIMKEVVVPDRECFALVRGSPYRDRINTIIHRVHAAGLSIHWEKMFEILNGQNHFKPTIFDRKVLTLEDLKSTFTLLVGGLTLSGILFLGEQIWFRSFKVRDKIFEFIDCIRRLFG